MYACTQIADNGQLSVMQYVLFGITRGSVLGPLLDILYMAELAHVVAGNITYLLTYLCAL